MNITHYEVSPDLDEVLERVLNFPELDKVKEHIKVVGCFKVTEKTVGGEGDTDTFELVEPKDGKVVTIKKIPPEMKLLMDGANDDQPWVLIIVDKYAWGEWKVAQKQKALHNYLSKLEAKEAKDGGFKAAINPWEIQCNTSTIRRFGVENDPDLQRLDEQLASLRVRNIADEPVEPKPASKPAPAVKPAPVAKPAAKPAAKPVAKAAVAKSSSEMPSDEDPMPGDDPDDPPRVRMAELPLKSKVSPLKASKNDEKEKTAPARKPPASAPVEDDTTPEPDA
jgi:hypothetical protein